MSARRELGRDVDAAPGTRRQADRAARPGDRIRQVDEIVGALITIAPIVGLARVVSAAPELALARG
jgi:hypothetical protein